MPKARGVQGKETEGLHQRVDAAVPEAKSGGTLLLDNDGLGDGIKVVTPIRQSWLRCSTRKRRRLAAKPISRNAGRLERARPISKSYVSLIVVSVRRA
jgi:hypothetical protein